MLDTAVTETKQTQYDYRETLAASQRVNWRIEDIIGDDKLYSQTGNYRASAENDKKKFF